MGLPQSRRLAQEHHLNSQLTLTSLFQNQLHKLHYIIVFFVYLFVCPCLNTYVLNIMLGPYQQCSWMYFISTEALMEQAMIGPSPNPLILSYLKYAISSQVRLSCHRGFRYTFVESWNGKEMLRLTLCCVV